MHRLEHPRPNHAHALVGDLGLRQLEQPFREALGGRREGKHRHFHSPRQLIACAVKLMLEGGW